MDGRSTARPLRHRKDTESMPMPLVLLLLLGLLALAVFMLMKSSSAASKGVPVRSVMPGTTGHSDQNKDSTAS
jgi:hypothetical protein